MVTFTVDGTAIQATTTPDLFSPKGLDQGTRLLLEAVSNLNVASVLDWGCGWGAISLCLGKRLTHTKVIGLDSDIGAVTTAQQNVALNELKNVEIIASQGFAAVAAGTMFDLICSNPPTHRGRAVVDGMIAESKDRLVAGGRLVIVVEARLKPWVARQMTAVFGNYKILKRGPKNVVLLAVKPL